MIVFASPKKNEYYVTSLIRSTSGNMSFFRGGGRPSPSPLCLVPQNICDYRGCLLRKRYECSPFFLQHASSIWQISFAPFVMPVQAIAVAFGLHSYGIYMPSHRHIIENAKFDKEQLA